MSGWAVTVVALLLALAVLLWPRGRGDAARRWARLRTARVVGRVGEAAVSASASASTSAQASAPARGARDDALESGMRLQSDLVMELVACGLRAGLSVPQALACAAASASSVGAGYLSGVVNRLRVGVPIDQAWGRPPPELSGLARAMVLAGLSGAPAADVVARAAEDARAARRERVEQAAARLGVQLVLPLGLAVLPGFVLLAVAPIVLGLASSVLRLGG
jgi:hypothetical protein